MRGEAGARNEARVQAEEQERRVSIRKRERGGQGIVAGADKAQQDRVRACVRARIQGEASERAGLLCVPRRSGGASFSTRRARNCPRPSSSGTHLGGCAWRGRGRESAAEHQPQGWRMRGSEGEQGEAGTESDGAAAGSQQSRAGGEAAAAPGHVSRCRCQ